MLWCAEGGELLCFAMFVELLGGKTRFGSEGVRKSFQKKTHSLLHLVGWYFYIQLQYSLQGRKGEQHKLKILVKSNGK